MSAWAGYEEVSRRLVLEIENSPLQIWDVLLISEVSGHQGSWATHHAFEMVGTVETQASTLLNQLLKISEITAQGYKLRPEFEDLPQLLTDLLRKRLEAGELTDEEASQFIMNAVLS